ncbi:MAG: plasmid pRiA4b ORF-3 family protein [Chitinispirillaceae bacterium]|nr:plasmid pRiA4b ORF-3 family protein [Chitinispirillaceae bacterium]
MNEDIINPIHYAHDETTKPLSSIADKPGTSFTYEYDFGDSWEHLITVKRILPDNNTFAGFAECIDGKRACPPEDCGGIGGYVELLDIISNPRHKEYRSMIEWLGGPIDPEAFDMKKVNRFLKKIKWKHPTVKQLARVLEERDTITLKITREKKSGGRKSKKR